MTTRKVKFTYQDYLLLPDEKRYELIEGELHMVPAPTTDHQDVSANLYRLLDAHVRGHNLGRVYFAPVDVVLSNEDVVQPDLLFVSARRRGIITPKNIQGPPDLVVEILSESTAQWDRTIKRKLYFKYGVREYWLVDPASKTIEVLAAGDEDFRTVRVHPEGGRVRSPLLEGLAIRVAEVFATP